MGMKNTFASPKAQEALDTIRTKLKTADDFSTSELGAAVGRRRSAIGPYLHYLESRGEVHRLPGAGFALFWKRGPAPTAGVAEPEYDDIEDATEAPYKRKFGAAQQIGMRRDSLVSALFGPAREALL